jgi:CBS domain containing-hemolysin-like protein
MPLIDFTRQFSIVPESSDVVTVSGYIIQLLGRVPERRAALRLGGWQAIVEAVDGIKVKSVRLRKISGEHTVEEERV